MTILIHYIRRILYINEETYKNIPTEFLISNTVLLNTFAKIMKNHKK